MAVGIEVPLDLQHIWEEDFRIWNTPGTPMQYDDLHFVLNQCSDALRWLADNQVEYSIIEYVPQYLYNVEFKDKGQAALFKLTWC